MDDELLPYARKWLDHIRSLHWTGEPASKIYDLLMHHAYSIDEGIGELGESEDRRNLLAIQAQTLTLAGNVAFLDLGKHRMAERLYRAAVRAGKRSSDPRLCSWIYSKMAHRRIYDPASDPIMLYDALYYSDSAKKYADGNPVVLASTYKTKAEIYATLGAETKAMRTLDLASEQLRLASAFPEWHNHFGPANISSMEGTCYLRLGNAKQAIASLESALAIEREDKAHEVIVLADTARAHAGIGEPERATELLMRAVPTASRAHSAIRTTRIRNARTALDPWATEPFVRELDGAMREASL